MSKYWLMRIASWIVPLAPMWLARPLANWAGAAVWALAPEMRRRVERNLRHIPALIEHPAQLQRAARGVFQTMCLNYLDFFRGAHLTNEQIFAGWQVGNEHLIDEAIAAGKGLVILTAHLGGFELGASRLGAKGYTVVAPAERMRPQAVFDLFCALREHHNMHLLPADSRETLRDLIAALKNNAIVVIVSDRHVTGSAVEVPFFGEPASLPTSAIALAQRTGAPALAVFSWRESATQFRGSVTPLRFETTEAGHEAVTAVTEGGGTITAKVSARARTVEGTTRAMETFVAELERIVSAHPDQWVSALTPIWDAGEHSEAERALADTRSASVVH